MFRILPMMARRSFAAKSLVFGSEARQRMLVGVERLTDAVATTLGPKGRNVVIEQSWGAPKITKDGVTVAKAIEFSDRYMNLGAQLVRSVANKANDEAGDGTTTASVLTRAIYAEGCKAVAAGMNPMDLRRGIEHAVREVCVSLKAQSKTITSSAEVEQVATISANDDKAIGALIARAMERVGKEGVITVADGKTLAHEVEVIEGMKFDQGYISRYFVTDAKKQTAELEDARVLIYDGKISSIQPLLPILDAVSRARERLLIIAEAVDGEALATLVYNKLRGLQVCAVKAPGFGDNRKVNLQDLAVLTGAQVVSDEVGLKLDDATVEHLGTVKRATVTHDDTLLMDGGGTPAALAERCDLIRESIERETSDYQKEKLQERLARLAGGVAVIRVGGGSEVEVNEVKDRIEDALNATRAAVAEGIVPGGGVALLQAAKSLASLESTGNFDQDIGVKIVRDALRLPMKTIANNCGVEGAVVVGKCLESTSATFGYNGQTGEYGDMIAFGIIDPTKVVRTALVDASSVAALLTTSEVLIVDEPKNEKEAAGGGMGGMPGGMGMGGMGGDMDF